MADVTSVVGLQYGDEGKGRIVDYLAKNAEIIIRYQGGDNAGHTVINEHGKFALHIVPSGVFNPDSMNIIGAGTALNLDKLKEEKDALEKALGYEVRNIFIEERAHLILPYHLDLDGAEEGKRSETEKIGTTKRGIGPCYEDKVARVGIRACDLLDEERLKSKLSALLPKKNRELEYYGLKTYTLDELLSKCKEWRMEFGSYIIDTVPIVREAVDMNQKILLEGQLGIMRDLDWGIYHYTTSSSPTSQGGSVGSSIPMNKIDRIVGVAKCYLTSVGGGPFMTELEDETGKRLREFGGEYGATTKRPRRCGWIDLVALDYATYINGATEVALTKIDVLDSFEKIYACTGYMIEGEYYSYLPETRKQEKARPIYAEFDGWMESTKDVRKYEDLPAKCKAFIEEIEKFIKVPIKMISIGPERDSLIIRD